MNVSTSVPDCLKHFQVEPIAESATRNQRLHGNTRTWRLRCPCGVEAFFLKGAQVKEWRGVCTRTAFIDVRPPFYTVCSGCARTTLLFDPEIHGWQGEQGLWPESQARALLVLAAPQAGAVCVRFHYGEEMALEALRAQGVVNLQDYFSALEVELVSSKGEVPLFQYHGVCFETPQAP